MGCLLNETVINKGGESMKVKESDVLVCKCKDCTIELTVTKACNPDACGVECDISASCCDGTIEIKKK
jgi:hypothetical protein